MPVVFGWASNSPNGRVKAPAGWSNGNNYDIRSWIEILDWVNVEIEIR